MYRYPLLYFITKPYLYAFSCYYPDTIVLLRHYCFIITQLQICMSITSNYYKIITTSLRSIIAMVLHISLVLLRHYCLIITQLRERATDREVAVSFFPSLASEQSLGAFSSYDDSEGY